MHCVILKLSFCYFQEEDLLESSDVGIHNSNEFNDFTPRDVALNELWNCANVTYLLISILLYDCVKYFYFN